MSTDFSMLNDQQKAAILESIDHNIVLLAGAGSGKTLTLVKRVEYLIKDLNIGPGQIMMITFTNKASGEMIDRLSSINKDLSDMWTGTFHSICLRILRIYGSYIGLSRFTVLDDDDSFGMIKKIINRYNFDDNPFRVRNIKSKISSYKCALVDPETLYSLYCKRGGEDVEVYTVYKEYCRICKDEMLVDFNDMILHTIKLIKSCSTVADQIHDTFRYIMIDEAQDTSTDQFELLKLFSGNNNIMMVGDVMQSIYGFRNANPEYINSFASTHPNTKVMKLEKNYRSTRTIIEAANAVVNNNGFGEKIIMTTDNEQGDRIHIRYLTDETNDGRNEALFVVSKMNDLIKKGYAFNDFAVIIRTHKQGQAFEYFFNTLKIPHVVYGGTSLWNTKELKDIFAFCKLCFNVNDTVSFERVLSTVSGLNHLIIDGIISYMTQNELNAKEMIDMIPNIHTDISDESIKELNTIGSLFDKKYEKCSDIADYVINNAGYISRLRRTQTEESVCSLETLDMIKTVLKDMEKGKDALSVMDQIIFMSEPGNGIKTQNAVKLLTAHACKGLEFNTVFICGAEEGVFPHYNAVKWNKYELIEEERRLFYVAMTRAKKNLYISGLISRENKPAIISRFVDEIPKRYCEID